MSKNSELRKFTVGPKTALIGIPSLHLVPSADGKKNCWTKWNNIGKDKNWTASCTLSWEDKALWWRGKVQPKIKTSPTPIQSPKNKHSYLFQAMTNEKLINGSLAENFLVSFGGYINYSVLRSISVTFGSITEWYNWLFSFFQQLELLKIEW